MIWSIEFSIAILAFYIYCKLIKELSEPNKESNSEQEQAQSKEGRMNKLKWKGTKELAYQ